ncbi:glycosyltransferase family 4 protein [Providencia vermicola]|uniref:Glycosyltransferase family 4 protein n=1 Tax=Providencia vermicola TaxID=333965 RepID=A0AAX3RVM9_9GAMM|nr:MULTISPECIES: glycosyltransferase family 4 protein [Providencia]ELX8379958.1 glycosyltransferase family 4 protein [Providencia stuartii]EMD5259347.1 glycosyltransferase family 4 protein [Providencia stuartii]USB37736.1 glycosyltransferase family 4 protein [Providencia vermicola]WFC06669.1 glycosyltransferase family 4 protein [Providencia vermicola]
MNILVLHWGRKGAGPKYNLEMATALQNQGCNVHAGISKQAENFHDYSKKGIKTYSINTYHDIKSAGYFLFRLPLIIKKTINYIKKNNITHVYCTMPHIFNVFLSNTFKKNNIKYLLIVHDAKLHSGEENWLIDKLIKNDRKNADGFVVLTNHVRNQLNSLNKPIHVIPHPVFSYGENNNVPKKMSSNTIKLIFFGRIHHYKGLDLLLESYKELTKHSFNFSLSIYGSGDLTPYINLIKDIPNLKIENRWILDSEIENILLKHDICVIPYRDASQSGVIPTAMNCGIPIIATPVDGLKEQIINGKTGIFTTEVSSNSIYQSILYLTSHPEVYEDISKNSIYFAKNNMSWNNAALLSIKALNDI